MKLFFREYGAGSPVIILHGLFGLSDNWVTFGRRLGETRHVIIPDLRNHGQSPSSEVFDFPSLAQDIRELMKDREITCTDVIGHSLGGKTAAMLALDSPDLIRKLVVVDISLRRYTDTHQHLHLIHAMKKVNISKAVSRLEVEKQLAVFVPSMKLRQFLLKSLYWKDKQTLAWRIHFSGIEKSLPEIFGEIATDKTFSGPALFIQGGLSDYIKNEDLPEIHKHFPEALVKTIPGASHWVHADEPELFYRIVTDFLQ